MNGSGLALYEPQQFPVSFIYIQLHIESKKKKRLRQEENATIEQLVAMGFPRERGFLAP